MNGWWIWMAMAGVLGAAEWIEPPARTASGYPVPRPGVVPELPAAHGAHRAHAIEWWYWVGHLEAVEGGEPFGFQATVFRRAGDAERAADAGEGVFGERQLYLAHTGLSDIAAGEFVGEQRVYREGWQARAEVGRLGLRVGPIRAREREGGEGFELRMGLEGDAELELVLVPEKPLVVFGERGLSRKGADPAAVSWYWTYPRLRAEGVLRRGDERMEVRGIAWMDHEISSSQLGSDLVGWDWTCLQLDDGTEVKAYRLRTCDGGMDPWSSVYWIDRAGRTRAVRAEGFSWEEDGWWRSERTGLRYPIEVTVRARDPADGRERVYRLRPRMEAQEQGESAEANPYWEGACEVFDESGARIGLAYLELAGYGGGLAERLGE